MIVEMLKTPLGSEKCETEGGKLSLQLCQQHISLSVSRTQMLVDIQEEVLHLLRVRLEIGPSDIGEWVPARLGASEEEAAAFALGTTLGVAGVKAHLKRVSLFTRLLRGNTNLSCS